MTELKTHFQLHFQPEQYVLYEEKNGQYYRKKWQEVSQYRDIKRVHYNTNRWKNYLIIDIDNDNLYKWREEGLPEPNFILKNKEKKGGHLFYVLDRGVYYKNEFYLEKWKTLQKAYTQVAGGDPLNKGYVGKFINSNHFEYEEINPYAYDINELHRYINHEPTNNQSYIKKSPKAYKYADKKKKKPSEALKSLDLVQIGERNDTLFNKTRKFAYIQVLQLSATEFRRAVVEYIERANDRLLVRLEHIEIMRTAESIINYCIINKESIQNYKAEDTINRGIMNLENQEMTLKEKQRLSATYTSKLKATRTELSISIALVEMKSQGLKINVSTVAKYTKISRPTATKYKHLWATTKV